MKANKKNTKKNVSEVIVAGNIIEADESVLQAAREKANVLANMIRKSMSKTQEQPKQSQAVVSNHQRVEKQLNADLIIFLNHNNYDLEVVSLAASLPIKFEINGMNLQVLSKNAATYCYKADLGFGKFIELLNAVHAVFYSVKQQVKSLNDECNNGKTLSEYAKIRAKNTLNNTSNIRIHLKSLHADLQQANSKLAQAFKL